MKVYTWEIKDAAGEYFESHAKYPLILAECKTDIDHYIVGNPDNRPLLDTEQEYEDWIAKLL